MAKLVTFEELMSVNSRHGLRIRRKVMKEVAAPALHEAVFANFIAGGRPKFRRNTETTLFGKGLAGQGRDPLYGSGALFEKAILNPVRKSNENEAWLEIRNPTNALKASAKALHDGKAFSILGRDRMRKFFWAMYYAAVEAGELAVANRFKAAALSVLPGVTIVIFPRPWTRITRGQLNAIKRAVEAAANREIAELFSKKRRR